MSEPEHRHRVLVVDDHVDTLATLTVLLGKHDVEAQAAASGVEAIDKLKAGAWPCLILLDVRMPGMDGWEFWQWQQEDVTFADIPVVIVTGDGEDPGRARMRGVREVLAKPVEIGRVLALIDQHCPPRR
jgi:CheY-like chemotaxis protein